MMDPRTGGWALRPPRVRRSRRAGAALILSTAASSLVTLVTVVLSLTLVAVQLREFDNDEDARSALVPDQQGIGSGPDVVGGADDAERDGARGRGDGAERGDGRPPARPVA